MIFNRTYNDQEIIKYVNKEGPQVPEIHLRFNSISAAPIDVPVGVDETRRE